MGQPVTRNRKNNPVIKHDGLTLVEVMIALSIFLLVFMGLFQTALLSVGHNMKNVLRDEAISIASARMEEARSMPFEAVVNDTADSITDDALVLASCHNPPVNDADPYPVERLRDFRNIQDFPFGTRRTVIDYAEPSGAINTKQIEILVRWEYQNECYTHSVTSLRRR